MADERDSPTVVDYLVAAINPALIMLLVGSLVFFLLEVFYAGDYGADMRYTLFFFIIAIVLITRIAMTKEISGRVGCYAPILGLSVWTMMQRYVSYPAEGIPEGLRAVINIGLIALVWWSAHRLTWDCTYRKDEVDRGGEGLLAVTGLSDANTAVKPPVDPDSDEAKSAKPPGWLERYRSYRDGQTRKRTQGTWVIYFSLAALPLFGLGQSLIPVDAEDRRRYAFWLMTLYVGSGLGLLLTTSFLGLRRYLRQRKIKMPAALTSVWLGTGTTLIVVLLVLGAFLPRPNAEYPLIDFTPAKSPELEASNYAMRGGKAGKGEGKASGEGKDEKAKDGGEGKDNEAKTSGDKKDQDAKSVGDKKNDDAKDGGDKKDDDAKNDGDKKDNQNRDNADKKADQKSKTGSTANKKATSKQGRTSSGSRPPRGLIRNPLSFIPNLAPILKWIVFGIVALIVLFVVLRNGLKFLANFLEWARQLLEALRNLFGGFFGFGGGKTESDIEEADKLAEQPFTSFHNPFHDGRCGRMSVKELLCYSYGALQAWARERGYPRQIGETPTEFVVRLGDELPAMEGPARRLTNLYVRAVYAPEVLPDSCAGVIEAFWEELEVAGERRLAGV